MKSENFHALTSELTQLTPHQRSILSDRLREIEHASSVSRTLIEERLSNQRRFDANGYFTRSFGRLGVPTINANIALSFTALQFVAITRIPSHCALPKRNNNAR